MEFFKKIVYKDHITTTEEIRAAVPLYKVIHLAEFNFDIPAEDFYAQLSEKIGKIHAADEDIATGKLTGSRWIDITYDPKIPDRYRSSNTRQPLHTDDSYVELHGEDALQFFFCASNAKLGGATTFIDLDVIVECLKLDGEDELLEKLLSTDVIHAKGGISKTRKIIDKDDIGYLANWNYFCIDRESNSQEVIDLCERLHAFLEGRIITSGLQTEVPLKKGEAAFFHDDRIFHGRNNFFAEFAGQRSLIKGKIILSQATETV